MPITSCAPRLAEMKASPQTQAGIDPPGQEEVVGGAHVALEGEADAQHEGEIDQHDQPVDIGEVHFGLSLGDPLLVAVMYFD